MREILFSAEKPVRGSDSPPDCHSTPLTSNPFYFINKRKRYPLCVGIFFLWRRERDSNPRTDSSVTRFPIVRLRPAQPSLRVTTFWYYSILYFTMQELF